MQGTVARIMPERGFGFIRSDTGEELFFHISALKGTDWGELAPGTRVEFDVEQHARGDRPNEEPRAIDVHLAPGAIPAVDNTQLPPEKVR